MFLHMHFSCHNMLFFLFILVVELVRSPDSNFKQEGRVILARYSTLSKNADVVLFCLVAAGLFRALARESKGF